jgi:DNA (cytosine-5)-methyltransferase 1
MAFLTSELEARGFRWAYRLVDSRFGGVPQRRHRVLFVASRTEDPRGVLFADEVGEPDVGYYRDDAAGFYWTEGLSGIGWAPDGVPPLKGGSGVGIASPPGIWVKDNPVGRQLVVPNIEEAERLQGFPAGWTEPVARVTKNGPRWKLVGNAVSTVVADWLVRRLEAPGDWMQEAQTARSGHRWPSAAWGHDGVVVAMNVSTWPERGEYTHLTDLVDVTEADPLSARATAGFLTRASKGKLRLDEDFILSAKRHLRALEDQPRLVPASD